MKRFLIKLHWLLSAQFGIDPLRLLRSLRVLPVYVRDWRAFRRSFQGKMIWVPCLHDHFEEAGATKNEYFWQDLLVAQRIFETKPERHVDVGSRLDGFVAHVASFRSLEVMDVRVLSSTIPNVTFRQADLMDMRQVAALVRSTGANDAAGEGYCDSLSCLHALEHFGLGRYGDPSHTDGWRLGMQNLVRLLKLGGTLYLSVPIGQERVEFNANWVFDPRTIVTAAKQDGLTLTRLTVIMPDGDCREPGFDDVALAELAAQPYHLGLFVFLKKQGLCSC